MTSMSLSQWTSSSEITSDLEGVRLIYRLQHTQRRTGSWTWMFLAFLELYNTEILIASNLIYIYSDLLPHVLED